MERRINVSLPDELHTALRVYCVEHRLTMAEVIAAALAQMLTPAPPTPARRAKTEA